ncbi:MAG: hypothetical protein GY757_02965 [bacterium]|nr:hypothetical protein [bacterium]
MGRLLVRIFVSAGFYCRLAVRDNMDNMDRVDRVNGMNEMDGMDGVDRVVCLLSGEKLSK